MGEYSPLDGNGPARMKPTTDHAPIWHSLDRDSKHHAMTTLTVIQKTQSQNQVHLLTDLMLQKERCVPSVKKFLIFRAKTI